MLNRKIVRNKLLQFMITLLCMLYLTGCKSDISTETLNSPVIDPDLSLDSGQNVTWDCVWFGSYPQTEIVDKPETCGVYEEENDDSPGYIVDPSLYSKLESSEEWYDNEITIDGVRYRRIKTPADVEITADHGDYRWDEEIAYHFFRYDKIKWRVLQVKDGQMYLLADQVLDAQPYHMIQNEDVTWEESTLRSWLNGYDSNLNKADIDYTEDNFIDKAFNSSEIASILPLTNDEREGVSSIDKNSKTANDSPGDKIYLLSSNEVYKTDVAASYGFIKDDKTKYDEARRARCSTYSNAVGVWKMWDSYYAPNCYWWLQSPGLYSDSAAHIDYCGYVYDDGDEEAYYSNRAGVRPAITVKLSSDQLWSYAGTVSSERTKNDEDNNDGSISVADRDTDNSRELTSGKTYTDFDLNGDGEADSFRITPYDDNDNGDITLTLNGSSSKIFVARGSIITYYKYDNDNEYLLVNMSQYGGSSMSAYRYEGNELQEVSKMNLLARNEFSKVEGGIIYIESSSYHYDSYGAFKKFDPGESYDIPTFMIPFSLDADSHTFSLASQNAEIKEPMEVTYIGKPFQTSSDPEKMDNNGLELLPGMKYIIKGLYILSEEDDYICYYKVEADGQDGWFAQNEIFK